MTEQNDSGDGDEPWVVYTLTSPRCKPGQFLEVVGSKDAAEDAQDKWIKALKWGDKKEPAEYEGVSARPVVGWENWPNDKTD